MLLCRRTRLRNREIERLTPIVKEIIMSQLTDAAAAIVAAIKAGESTIDAAHIATLDAPVATPQDGQAVNTADIADIKDAFNLLKDGLAPAAPAPAPTPEPAPAGSATSPIDAGDAPATSAPQA
mgnify:CR=1 FL=1